MNPNGKPFIVEVGTIDEYSGGQTIELPTIMVKDPTPYGREGVKRDTLQFGALDEAHTDGTWRRAE